MAWPLSQDYNEAIQDPPSCLADPELRGGQPVVNALSLPVPRSGNFADVYEFQGVSGARWALKCFTRQVPGLRDRYTEISKCLAQLKLPFTVDFQFVEQGIRVAGNWYPILKMQWVDGFLLNEFVRNNLDKTVLLEGLGQIWLRMGKRLHEAGVAHADLQHGNVILVPGSKANLLSVRLVDYDGMWVPSLASKRSGEVGHGAYQHPQRLKEGIYSPEVDRLPLLAIACGLRALVVGGKALWDRFDTGDNLLFREADLREPAKSPLFKLLWNLPDAATHDLVGQLTLSLSGPLERVPLLHEVMADGQPRPLKPEQEEQTTAILGPGAKVSRAAAVISTGPNSGVRVGPPPEKTRPLQAIAKEPAPRVPSPATAAGRKKWLLGALAVLVVGVVAAGAMLLGGGKEKPSDSGTQIVKGDPKKKNGEKPKPADPVVPDKGTGEKPKDPGPENPASGEPAKSITNSIGMKLVYIPAGKFLMGSPEDEKDRYRNEAQHEVEITKAFHMGTFEVTQAQFRTIIGTNPSFNSASGKAAAAVAGLDTDDFPVEGVTWHQALEFCRKLSDVPAEREAGRSYDLPTEAEWEYACRGNSRSYQVFHHGNSLSGKDERINGDSPFGGAEKVSWVARPTKVGSYKANPFGLHDMHGNVREWCKDWFGPPGTARVFRGGAFDGAARYARSASRNAAGPGVVGYNIGFRVVMRPRSKDETQVAKGEPPEKQPQPAPSKNDTKTLAEIVCDEARAKQERIAAAMALIRLGPSPEARDAVPGLLRVLGNRDEDAEVRLRTIWALRVHGAALGKMPEVMTAFADVLAEPKEAQSKMLRFDCAYMLGTLQGPATDESVLPHLLDFLKDSSIKVFKGQVNGKDTGAGDGRAMAIQALTQIGAKRLAARREIVLELTRIADDERTDPELHAVTRTLLASIQSVPAAIFEAGKAYTNKIGMKLIPIPPGKFQMGSPETEKSRLSNETQHAVEISRGFHMGVHEVTQGQYGKVMGKDDDGRSSFFSKDGAGKKQVADLDTSDFPMENVSWKDALTFCNKLTALDGRDGIYDLPTEAEWEYACRGGSKDYQVFHHGDTLSSAQANFFGQLPYFGDPGPSLKRPAKVGSYAANAFGLYDMHGNIAEWCKDWHAAYDTKEVVDPQGPATGSARVHRGGFWADTGASCRSAARAKKPAHERNNTTGFRVVFRSNVKGQPALKEVPDPEPPSDPKKTPPKKNPSKIAGTTFANSMGMRLAYVPAGTFMMGSLNDDSSRRDETQHEVEISRGFFIGVHEVTVGQFKAFSSERRLVIPRFGFQQDVNHPQVNVTWNEAMDFCVTVHALASNGAGFPAIWASTAVVSHAKALCDWRRQVSITVSRRSTKRLPPFDCVPKESLRQ
ncbi:MAG: hypothetical protein FJ271_23110, partial [Planctomycetes bacterium]|nr:hypothetical protein [Planctomycetota bacterium]